MCCGINPRASVIQKPYSSLSLTFGNGLDCNKAEETPQHHLKKHETDGTFEAHNVGCTNGARFSEGQARPLLGDIAAPDYSGRFLFVRRIRLAVPALEVQRECSSITYGQAKIIPAR